MNMKYIENILSSRYQTALNVNHQWGASDKDILFMSLCNLTLN